MYSDLPRGGFRLKGAMEVIVIALKSFALCGLPAYNPCFAYSLIAVWSSVVCPMKHSLSKRSKRSWDVVLKQVLGTYIAKYGVHPPVREVLGYIATTECPNAGTPDCGDTKPGNAAAESL